MAREKPKPPVLKLHELTPNQPPADVFALLAEKTRGTTRDGKPYYTCKFRDNRRTVGCVVWADSPSSPSARRTGSRASSTRSGACSPNTSGTARRSTS